MDLCNDYEIPAFVTDSQINSLDLKEIGESREIVDSMTKSCLLRPFNLEIVQKYLNEPLTINN